ncbi:MAG: nicotinate-nucleotide diphosphorylase (carboxylating) [Candidatus Magasanikbacteria bacterium CG_4_10_14_0_2_um_filter_37_12]|uniref:Probable nicotinate-nucleotide pyrophosphorylase [carboxylating] n=1 Tax=Candidatus Magasanikbacteria bacterium CG_4_10_14_0_2_um_filter_37_12 TaxID=1974637 RepID=A0A2M7V8F9_9BACT|nr:MAG: nicotinate-nucleotide diphosphorylase (carboxylating) [Candidatus Magasanikbacteria bacterium CG_4_10_14_0_2_um_filter_37_12]
MKKSQTIKKYFNQKEKLTLKNSKYLRQVKRLTEDFLIEDLEYIGDITTDTVIKENPKTIAIIKSKQNGIIAGIEETKWFLSKYKIHVTTYKKDGVAIKKNENILKLNGGIKDILKIERAILNLMQRMSGIATETSRLVALAKNKVLICPTRKTQWGLVDKRAVTLGGGGTHRLGLYDWILIKDNHLKISNFQFPISNYFTEIEAKTKKQILQFTKLSPDAIMFDNFKPKEIKKIVKQIGKTNIIFEASGGITKKNIVGYIKSGVNIISLGSLTHSVKSLDISLDIL